MPPLSLRKQQCGADKRKKRKKQLEFLKSQENAILKFVKKPETAPSIRESETVGTPRDEGDIGQSNNFDPENLEECKENDEQEGVVHQREEKKKERLYEDISDDPVNWENIDMKLRDLLVENGPTKRLSTDYQFPKDSIGRHFSQTFYTRELVNGEKQDRRWLVYSKASDKVFCFCCKLFRHEKNGGGNLATTGYNNWKNLSNRLKEHERLHEHMICMTRWRELELRLEKKQTIDKLFKRD